MGKMRIDLGFTGTQSGMNARQAAMLVLYMQQEVITSEHRVVFHHGDCIGADVQAAEIARKLKFRIVSHPCDLDEKRAWFYGSDEIREPLPPRVRNHVIVDESDFMFATPRTEHETLRSGTWATIRYARKTKTPIFVLYPSGKVEDPS